MKIRKANSGDSVRESFGINETEGRETIVKEAPETMIDLNDPDYDDVKARMESQEKQEDRMFFYFRFFECQNLLGTDESELKSMIFNSSKAPTPTETLNDNLDSTGNPKQLEFTSTLPTPSHFIHEPITKQKHPSHHHSSSLSAFPIELKSPKNESLTHSAKTKSPLNDLKGLPQASQPTKGENLHFNPKSPLKTSEFSTNGVQSFSTANLNELPSTKSKAKPIPAFNYYQGSFDFSYLNPPKNSPSSSHAWLNSFSAGNLHEKVAPASKTEKDFEASRHNNSPENSYDFTKPSYLEGIDFSSFKVPSFSKEESPNEEKNRDSRANLEDNQMSDQKANASSLEKENPAEITKECKDEPKEKAEKPFDTKKVQKEENVEIKKKENEKKQPVYEDGYDLGEKSYSSYYLNSQNGSPSQKFKTYEKNNSQNPFGFNTNPSSPNISHKDSLLLKQTAKPGLIKRNPKPGKPRGLLNASAQNVSLTDAIFSSYSSILNDSSTKHNSTMLDERSKTDETEGKYKAALESGWKLTIPTKKADRDTMTKSQFGQNQHESSFYLESLGMLLGSGKYQEKAKEEQRKKPKEERHEEHLSPNSNTKENLKKSSLLTQLDSAFDRNGLNYRIGSEKNQEIKRETPKGSSLGDSKLGNAKGVGKVTSWKIKPKREENKEGCGSQQQILGEVRKLQELILESGQLSEAKKKESTELVSKLYLLLSS